MKIAISVLGRFHAFDLAGYLEKQSALTQLLTSYPAYLPMRSGIPREKITSHVVNELMSRAWGRLPKQVQQLWNPWGTFARHYDNWASRNLDLSANLFVGWSCASLATLRRAAENGMKTVVERCSTHIVHQTRVLEEEYAHFGMVFTGTSRETIDRELQEYKESDRIAVPSEFVKRTFLAQGVAAEKILKIPYGVNLAQFPSVPRTDNTFRIVFCGTLSVRKGVPRLLKAFHELNFAAAELSLIGPITDEIKPFLVKYRASNIIVHGPKSQAELRNYYARAKVFFLPSIEEGMAYVVPQAMSCGLPVFCTRETGAEEAIEDGKEGRFFKARDDDSLKEALETAYRSQEELREMGAAARKKISGAFTWAHYGARAMAAYEEILGLRATARLATL